MHNQYKGAALRVFDGARNVRDMALGSHSSGSVSVSPMLTITLSETVLDFLDFYNEHTLRHIRYSK
jgi:hypothetical protein